MKRWPVLALFIVFALVVPGLVSADTLDDPNGLNAQNDPENGDPVESQTGEAPAQEEDIPDLIIKEDARSKKDLSTYFYDPTPSTPMEYFIDWSEDTTIPAIEENFLVLNAHNKPNWHGFFSMRLKAVDPDFPDNDIHQSKQ